MNCRVATGRPARGLTQKGGVINSTYGDCAAALLYLRMASQAQAVVIINHHLAIDRTVGSVAGHTAFAHRFMFEDGGSCLFAMTSGARFVEPGHGQTARGFHDVEPVRVVALHAIHPAFDDWMMLRQIEFRVSFKVALKASRGVFAGIDDEFAATTANLSVFAARPVTGFAACVADGR